MHKEICMNKERYTDSKEALDFKNNKDRDRFYGRMSIEQKELFSSIQTNIFTYCEAKAGTGKTVTSMAAMLDLLSNGIISKIVYIQKPSERYLSQGYYPGTAEEKAQFIFLPFYDACNTLGLFESTITKAINDKVFILTTDSSLRGVNFENAGILVDETENCNYRTLKLIFTRIHDSCHVVALGDRLQKDNKGSNTDFIDYCEYLSNQSFGNKCNLSKNYRGKFSRCAEDFEFKREDKRVRN